MKYREYIALEDAWHQKKHEYKQFLVEDLHLDAEEFAYAMDDWAEGFTEWWNNTYLNIELED